jgi:ENTS family enterobactin (siderophore) exporter
VVAADVSPGAGRWFDEAVRHVLADITPLRVSRDYRRMFVGAALSSIGASVTQVAVGLQVYAITGSTLSVGLVGLFAVVPLIGLGLYGGSIVDAHDRRTVVLVTATGMLLIAVAMTGQAWARLDSVWLLYVLVALQSGCYAVNSPARSAMIPRLLSADLLPAANALSGLMMALDFMLGPLLAGYLIDWLGYPATYAIEVVMLVAALTTMLRLPPVPVQGQSRPAGLRSVVEGLGFLRTRANVRMTFLVDLAAMVLAMPRVLVPALGTLYLGGGARTVGLLGAALAVGSVLAGVFSGPLTRLRRQGRAVVVSVVIWGVSVAAFGSVLIGADPPPSGLNSVIVPAAALLAVAGAADQVSAVFRMTILQSAVPDALRGRLQGIFTVVVAGGPRLGDVVLGGVAGVAGEPGAALTGGLCCVATVIVLALRQPGFLRYDAAHPRP